MTKWERIFRSHYPDADIEAVVAGGQIWHYEVSRDGHRRHAGCGTSILLAWKFACRNLRITTEKVA